MTLARGAGHLLPGYAVSFVDNENAPTQFDSEVEKDRSVTSELFIVKKYFDDLADCKIHSRDD